MVLFFGFVLFSMLIITSWASLQENVFAGGARLLNQPWGVATLADAYFGFLTFYLWVLYKETSALAKLLWLIAILALGNIAMASYLLWQVRKMRTNQFSEILLRSSSAVSDPSS